MSWLRLGKKLFTHKIECPTVLYDPNEANDYQFTPSVIKKKGGKISGGKPEKESNSDIQVNVEMASSKHFSWNSVIRELSVADQ